MTLQSVSAAEPLLPVFMFTLYVEKEELAQFTEITLPSLDLDVKDYTEGGMNEYTHALVGRRKPSKLVLKRGMTKDKKLLQWYLDVLAGNVAAATKDVAVVVFDVSHKPVAFWFFGNAIPVKWSGPNLKAGESAIAIDTLELAVHDFQSIDV